MPVSAGEFRAWLDLESLPGSPTMLSGATGLSRGQIKNQILRESVAESTVVAVARAFGRNPAMALSHFQAYADIARQGATPPTSAELISQIHVADLMTEFTARTTKAYAEHHRERPPLIQLPHDGSVRTWLDAVDNGEIRKKMSEETGVAAPNIATQLGENRLSPALAYAASRAAGVSLVSGFVVTALISPNEAWWPIRAREDALLETSDADLVDTISQRLHTIRRKLQQREEFHAHAKRITDGLG